MKDGRIKNVSRNLFWGMVGKTGVLLVQFLSRTILIHVLGTQYVGLNSLFTSVLNVLNLTELGFGSALVYSMYKPAAENDVPAVCALLNFFKKCYRLIGGVILVLGLLLLPFLKYFIAGSPPEEINIFALYMIYLFNTVISYFLFAYKKSLFIANQRKDIEGNIAAALLVLQNLVQCVLLILLRDYYAFILAMPVFTLLSNAVIAFCAGRYYPELKCRGEIEPLRKKEILQKVKGILLQKLGSIVIQNIGSIVISAFLGLTALGIYNNYYYIIVALIGITQVVVDGLKPSVGNAIALESVEKNFCDFKRLNFSYLLFIEWCCACLLALYQSFMKLWVGEENMLALPMAVLFVAFFFIYRWIDMLYVYQEAMGLWWENRYVSLAGAVLNAILSVILVRTVGLPGALLATIVSYLLVVSMGYAYILFRHYFGMERLGGYIKEQLLCTFKGILCIAVVYLAVSGIGGSGPEAFAVKLAAASVLAAFIMVLLNFRKKEFQDMARMARGLFFRGVRGDKEKRR